MQIKSVTSKSHILEWVIPLVAFVNSWSFLGGWVILFSRVWLWLVIGIFALLFIVPGFFRTRSFFALMVYAVVVIINHLFGDGYYNTWPYVFSDIFMCVFYGGVCYHIMHGCSRLVQKAIIFSIMFVIVFTSIATYRANLIFPDIVRTMVTFINRGLPTSQYYRLGVCEYAMPHALPILIAPILLWMKNKELKWFIKALLVTFLFFILLLVWTSGATTPLLLSFFALLTSLFINIRKSLKHNVLVLLLLSLVVMPTIDDDVQLGMIYYLETVVPTDNANYGKLKNFEDNIKYGSDDAGDITSRKKLYNRTITTIISHPIFGTDDKNEIGGHSTFMDRFAMLGLVGIIPFLLFLIWMFKDVYYNIHSNNRVIYLIGIICFSAMLILKNMTGTWMFLAVFVMLPAMINLEIE